MEFIHTRKSKKSTKQNAKKRAPSTQRRGGDSQAFGPDGRMVIFKVNTTSTQVSRNFLATSLVSSDASGGVAISSISVANAVNSLLGTEFTNYAQEYQQYRVMNIKAHFWPSTTSATSTTGPYQGALIAAPYVQFPVTSITSLQQAEQKEIWSTLQETKFFLSGSGFENAKLWNEFGVTYPQDRDYGFSYGLLGSSLAASSRVGQFALQIVCQFRKAQ
jgi:hypothetical protein